MERYPRILYYLPDNNQHSLHRYLALTKQLHRELPHAQQLVVSETLGETGLELLPGVDMILLSPRPQKMIPGIPMKQIQAHREQQILDIIFKFQPHLFLVDRLVTGLHGELAPSLRFLKVWSPQTKIVYGMPDIESSPHMMKSSWQKKGIYRLLDEIYDRILLFGQRDIFDPIMAYKMPVSTAVKVVECGYLHHMNYGSDIHEIGTRLQKSAAHYAILIIIDAVETIDNLSENMIQELPQSANGMPVHLTVLIASGTISQSKIDTFLSDLAHFPVEVVHFDASFCHRLVDSADLVLCHASYGSVCNVVARNKPTLFLIGPQTSPDCVMRAHMLSQAGLADICDLSSSANWENCLRSVLNRRNASPKAGLMLQVNGVYRASQTITSMLMN
ncbi:MAG: hypothetical protein KC419_01420 [Anaerolineales bacterium]|nr:hypothetical protein [Anaerolineales bacterium]